MTVDALLTRERELLEADPIALIRKGYLKIRDKAASLVPLVLNSTQNKILDLIQGRRRQGRPAFIFVLKARQLGVQSPARQACRRSKFPERPLDIQVQFREPPRRETT